MCSQVNRARSGFGNNPAFQLFPVSLPWHWSFSDSRRVVLRWSPHWGIHWAFLGFQLFWSEPSSARIRQECWPLGEFSHRRHGRASSPPHPTSASFAEMVLVLWLLRHLGSWGLLLVFLQILRSLCSPTPHPPFLSPSSSFSWTWDHVDLNLFFFFWWQKGSGAGKSLCSVLTQPLQPLYVIAHCPKPRRALRGMPKTGTPGGTHKTQVFSLWPQKISASKLSGGRWDPTQKWTQSLFPDPFHLCSHSPPLKGGGEVEIVLLGTIPFLTFFCLTPESSAFYFGSSQCGIFVLSSGVKCGPLSTAGTRMVTKE